MMKTELPTDLRAKPRSPAPGGAFPSVLKVPGHTLSMASDIRDLEECLALERSCGGRASYASQVIDSPPAVPYCEFLMLRSREGRLRAVCRLMRLDAGNPIGNPLASGRFHLSPLITALRYTREGILEMGIPAYAPESDAAEAARLLWSGMIRYLEWNDLGFVIGRDAVSVRAEAAHDWPRLMDSHGLHPDLEVETRSFYRAREFPLTGRARPYSLQSWPVGLREAMHRGCRLACEPVLDSTGGCLEFIWVASRDMLQGPESGDWRGTPSA
ncbi:MAG: hypothetical protein JWP91_2802 [Fibrobacteres bacterium]|nr:hypothetical protein [Fibrobacterota bacterium]